MGVKTRFFKNYYTNFSGTAQEIKIIIDRFSVENLIA